MDTAPTNRRPRADRVRGPAAAIATTVASAGVPYGYTITLWSSGAVMMHAHGTPTVGEVFAFMAGALAGFGLIAVIAHGGSVQVDQYDSQDGGQHSRERLLAGAFNWLAVGAAVGAAALLAQLHHWEAWAVGSLAATGIYLLLSSVQLYVARMWRR